MALIPIALCHYCIEPKKRKADFYCDQCDQFLCIECKREFHEKAPIRRDHIVVHISKAAHSVFKQKPVCQSHQKQFLYYCSNCDCLICHECMTSSHNGHTTETIKKVVDVCHEDAKTLKKNLEEKLGKVTRILKTINEKQKRQLKSDYNSYVEKLETTSKELYGIVEHIKKIDKTTASDFRKTEKQDLNMKRDLFQRHYDELSDTLLQIENLLCESREVIFFTDWKRLQTVAIDMCEIETTCQNPRRFQSFSEDNFMIAVITNIEKMFRKRSVKFISIS